MKNATTWNLRGLLLVGLLSTAMCGARNPDDACQQAAKDYCDYATRCTGQLVSILYDTLDTCVARIALGCKGSFFPMGSTSTPSNVTDCGEAVAQASCTQSITSITACDPPAGTFVAGQACREDAQCQTTFCKRAGSGCGVCAVRAKIGESCAATACERGLPCVPGSQGQATCSAPLAVGAACPTGTGCQASLSCINKVCTQVTYLDLGAACGANGQMPCDPAKGLNCNPVSKVCQAVKLVGAGEPCGTDATGQYSACRAAGSCKITQGSNMGNCVAAAGDGQPCNPSMGVGCLSPASCQNSICTLPSTLSCN